MALVRRRQGRLKEAAKLLATGFESDPRNGSLAEETGNTFRAARMWEEALSFPDHAIALSPDYPDGYLRKGDLLVSWKADLGAARATVEEGARLAGSSDFRGPSSTSSAANRAVEQLPMTMDAWAAGDMIESRAWVFALLGRWEEAMDDLEFLLANPTRSWISTSLLRVDPRWDGLRENARFLALLSAYAEEDSS